MKIFTSKCKLFFLLYCAFLILSSCEKLESHRLKINNNLREITDDTYKKVVIAKKDFSKESDIFKKLGIAFDMETQKIEIKTKEDQQSIPIESHEERHTNLIDFQLEKNKLFILEISSKNPIGNTQSIYELIINDINDPNKGEAYVFFIREITLNRKKRYLRREDGISNREREALKNKAGFHPKPLRNDAYPSEAVRPYLEPKSPVYVSKRDKVGFFLIRFFHPAGYLATELASALQSKDIETDLPLALVRISPLAASGFINNLGNRLLLKGNDASKTNLTFFEASALYNARRVPLFKKVLPRVSEFMKSIILKNFKKGQVNVLLNKLTKEENDRIDEIMKEMLNNADDQKEFKELTEKERNDIKIFILSLQEIIIKLRIYMEHSDFLKNNSRNHSKPKCTF